MKKVYFIPGLGVDSSVFQRIELPSGFEKVMLEWQPLRDDDSLETYALRMARGVELNGNDVIIGLSFGGLIAREIALKKRFKKLVLISSFRSASDLRFLPRIGLKFRAYKVVPNWGYRRLKGIAQTYFGGKSREGKILLKRMLDKTDYRFTKWAFNQIKSYQYRDHGELAVHNILGDRDPLISRWSGGSDHVIEGGNHFIIFERAEEVNRILQQIMR